ncbi:MAG: DUF2058 domain-containing protein [Candidatus Thiosymbion ectosymbiont of Robbea hypermnestra]|nr:DUF2058 domain-containing protein [Candidatus Thiosymbion ectosymbiont of Robbea hypermnestra]
MGNSLRDQLLKAGLVDKQQVKQARSSKRKQSKHSGGKEDPAAEERQRARRAAAEKAQRDRALERRRQEEARRKAEANELRQLIHANRIPRGEGDIAYSFLDGDSIKRIYVTDDQQKRLAQGKLAIVRQDTGFELVSPETAQRIQARDERLVVLLNKPGDQGDEDDDYADYKIPDDLMW